MQEYKETLESVLEAAHAYQIALSNMIIELEATYKKIKEEE